MVLVAGGEEFEPQIQSSSKLFKAIVTRQEKKETLDSPCLISFNCLVKV